LTFYSKYKSSPNYDGKSDEGSSVSYEDAYDEEVLTMSQFHQHFKSAFASILLRQKSSNLKYKYKKVSRRTFVQKICM
jgi:hypothetical protein